MKTAILSFILVLLCSCGAATKNTPTVDNDDVTDMLIWICFQHSDGSDAALLECGAEY